MPSFDLQPNISGAFMGKDTLPLQNKGFTIPDLVLLEQVHGDKVLEIRKEGDLKEVRNAEGDALISILPGVPIAVKTADCVPILIGHFSGVIAAVHAGWRGTRAKILPKVLRKLEKEYRLRLDELQMAIGPAICGDCYEVGADVIQEFKNLPSGAMKKKSKEKALLDLKWVNYYFAQKVGVPKQKIKIHEDCTLCDSEHYYSQRAAQAEGRSKTRRNYSWLLLDN